MQFHGCHVGIQCVEIIRSQQSHHVLVSLLVRQAANLVGQHLGHTHLVAHGHGVHEVARERIQQFHLLRHVVRQPVAPRRVIANDGGSFQSRDEVVHHLRLRKEQTISQLLLEVTSVHQQRVQQVIIGKDDIGFCHHTINIVYVAQKHFLVHRRVFHVEGIAFFRIERPTQFVGIVDATHHQRIMQHLRIGQTPAQTFAISLQYVGTDIIEAEVVGLPILTVATLMIRRIGTLHADVELPAAHHHVFHYGVSAQVGNGLIPLRLVAVHKRSIEVHTVRRSVEDYLGRVAVGHRGCFHAVQPVGQGHSAFAHTNLLVIVHTGHGIAGIAGIARPVAGVQRAVAAGHRAPHMVVGRVVGANQPSAGHHVLLHAGVVINVRISNEAGQVQHIVFRHGGQEFGRQAFADHGIQRCHVEHHVVVSQIGSIQVGHHFLIFVRRLQSAHTVGQALRLVQGERKCHPALGRRNDGVQPRRVLFPGIGHGCHATFRQHSLGRFKLALQQGLDSITQHDFTALDTRPIVFCRRHRAGQRHGNAAQIIGRTDGLVQRLHGSGIARPAGILVIQGLQLVINGRGTSCLELRLHALERIQQSRESFFLRSFAQIGQAEIVEHGPVAFNVQVFLHADAQSPVRDNGFHLVATIAPVRERFAGCIHIAGQALAIVHAGQKRTLVHPGIKQGIAGRAVGFVESVTRQAVAPVAQVGKLLIDVETVAIESLRHIIIDVGMSRRGADVHRPFGMRFLPGIRRIL